MFPLVLVPVSTIFRFWRRRPIAVNFHDCLWLLNTKTRQNIKWLRSYKRRISCPTKAITKHFWNPSFILPNMAMTSWICAAWGVKPPKLAPTGPLGMFPWQFIGFTPKFGTQPDLGPPGILAQPKLGTRACAFCCINVCCWGIHCAPNHAGPCPCITGMFPCWHPAPDTLDHLHPGLSCSHIPVHSVTHLLVVAVAAAAGAWYLLQVFVHPSQILVITTLLTRRSRHRWQSVSTVTTTISFTSFSHTRTRTTLYTLAPWIHSYYASTSCKQAAPLCRR